MTKLRVGLVGLGEIAQIIHLPILQAQADKFEYEVVTHNVQPKTSAEDFVLDLELFDMLIKVLR
jgi:predicted dehydrogenase